MTELPGCSLPDELGGSPRWNELSGSLGYVFELHGINRILLKSLRLVPFMDQ
jgi:hypothetical protein